MISKTGILLTLALAAGAVSAATVIETDGAGTEKFAVAINVKNAEYARCLKKNLELSGRFVVQGAGSITVSDGAGGVTASGRGKSVTGPASAGDAAASHMAARQLADAMCEAYAEQKGFACNKLVFINRGKPTARGEAMPGEICTGYPDGLDLRQHTKDGKAALFPRWCKDGETLVYIGYLNGGPQVWELNTRTGKRSLKFSFKGSTTGLAVSPDGRRLAAILSFQGNPELYVLDLAGKNWTRLTTTPLASEGQPSWSPDGRKIVYVSDETRHPQLYVIDVATRAKRRLTSRGSQNVDPDWGPDGRIAYITKRGGSTIAVLDPAEGEAAAKLVTKPGNWEHPSWSRNGRHLVADSDRALWVIDTLEGGDEPRRMFSANGNWIAPTWAK